MRVLHNSVLIRKQEQTSAGGIVLSAHKDDMTQGEVIAVGPGVYQNGDLVRTTVRKGDIVLYRVQKGMTLQVTMEGDFFDLVSEDCVQIILD